MNGTLKISGIPQYFHVNELKLICTWWESSLNNTTVSSSYLVTPNFTELSPCDGLCIRKRIKQNITYYSGKFWHAMKLCRQKKSFSGVWRVTDELVAIWLTVKRTGGSLCQKLYSIGVWHLTMLEMIWDMRANCTQNFSDTILLCSHIFLIPFTDYENEQLWKI